MQAELWLQAGFSTGGACWRHEADDARLGRHIVCRCSCGGLGDAPTVGPEHLEPADFVEAVDHPYFPLEPGNAWHYKVTSSDGDERIDVTVLDRRKRVDGVPATIVHDRVRTVHGRVVEDTYDWYAQDKKGNVWYLGEATKAFGRRGVSTKGSWEAGVDGARAGLIMPAEPRVGRRYQQEYAKGEAEDQGEILAVGETVKGPTGTYRPVVRTQDTTPLEPGLVESKWYAKGVGIVREADVKGGDERVVLVSWSSKAMR